MGITVAAHTSLGTWPIYAFGIHEYPVCRFYRDAKTLTIGEGTDELQQR